MPPLAFSSLAARCCSPSPRVPSGVSCSDSRARGTVPNPPRCCRRPLRRSSPAAARHRLASHREYHVAAHMPEARCRINSGVAAGFTRRLPPAAARRRRAPHRQYHVATHMPEARCRIHSGVATGLLGVCHLLERPLVEVLAARGSSSLLLRLLLRRTARRRFGCRRSRPRLALRPRGADDFACLLACLPGGGGRGEKCVVGRFLKTQNENPHSDSHSAHDYFHSAPTDICVAGRGAQNLPTVVNINTHVFFKLILS